MWNPQYHDLLDLLIDMKDRCEIVINIIPMDYDLDNSSKSRCNKLESLIAERVESVSDFNKQKEKIRQNKLKRMNARIIGPIIVDKYNYDEQCEDSCSDLYLEDDNCIDHIGQLARVNHSYDEIYDIIELMYSVISEDYQLTAPRSSIELLDLEQEEKA